MKKRILFFYCVLSFTFYAYGQNNPTPDQIRQKAKELGVPYEELQKLVDAQRPSTGLKNPNAKKAQQVSIQELKFMKESDKLKIGSFYLVQQVEFFNQSGRTVYLYHRYKGDMVIIDSDFNVTLPKGTSVDALIGVKPDYKRRPRELYLVEIAKANYKDESVYLPSVTKPKEEAVIEHKQMTVEEKKLSEEEQRLQEKAISNLVSKTIGSGNVPETQQGETTATVKNQGSPFGGTDKGANEGIGGSGLFNLNERYIGQGGLPRPKYLGQEVGKIVLDIIVAPDGNVISAKIGKGTNIDNAEMRKSAEEAAMMTKFNKTNKTQNQTGTITYRYEMNESNTSKTSSNSQFPKQVRMTAGSSLKQLAVDYYGDKIFWVYIYEHNKSRIGNSDNVPVGTELILPPPNLFGIDPKSTTSLEKARQKQREIIMSW